MNRESIGDCRSVYTERTAEDLELARHEDDIAQKKSFQFFFNPLPPFPTFQQAKKRSSSPSNMTDTHSEVSDLTFVSYNPRQPPTSKLPRQPLPPIPSMIPVNFNGQGQSVPTKASGPESVTGSENDPSRHAHKRFSWIAGSNDAKFGPNGRDLLTASMLVYRKEMSLSDAEVTSMMQQASKLPAVLMGWQIKLEIPQSEEERNAYGGGQAPSLGALGQAPTPTWMIFVITGIRKNAVRKTEFRISSLLREDQWILLKRSDNKVGYDFQPLRQVLSFPK
jgi:hypothetical protein